MAKAIKTATKRKAMPAKTTKTVKATKRPARKTSSVRAKTTKIVAKPAARRSAGRPARKAR
jgi:hypothetical protein